MLEGVIILVLVGIECLEVGLNTLSKAAMRKGMSNFVFVFYSNALALLLLIPSTIIFHRIRPGAPQITFSIVCRIFLLALISCSVQILMYVGIGYSSATLSSAIIDLTPAFTFILAILTRMEKLELKAHSGQAKLVGTVLSITGAFVVTFYKGPTVLFSGHISDAHEPLMLPQSNWAFGGSLLAAAAFLLAVLYIYQTRIIKDYPAELMVTVICCFFVTVQSAIVALITERNPSAWNLRPDVELVTICYSAIAVVSLRSVVLIWALRKKGPVFVTMFKPLGMVIAVVMGVAFLGDILHIGSVIGGIIIALGFYSLMWGKTKELNGMSSSHSSSHKVPLLQNKCLDV